MTLLLIFIVVLSVITVLGYHIRPYFNQPSHSIWKSCVHERLVRLNQNNIYRSSRIYQMALKSPQSTTQFEVGDYVIAQVSDFGGTVSDPVVEFTIDKEGKRANAKMPTKYLNPNEKMALQYGVMMQVYVSKVSSLGDIEVSLRKSNPVDTSSSSSTIFTKPTQTTSVSSPSKSSPSWAKDLPKPENKRPKTSYPSKTSILTKTIPDDGILLTSLKTGKQLEGVVRVGTNYAAFVDSKVYRKAKGEMYLPINGMLHREDIASDVPIIKGPGYVGPIMENGTRLTVYVKEVWKQSGRYTLTTDPNVNKAKILEIKGNTREQSKSRRLQRRLRRQLSTVSVGSLTTGVIQRITSEGILVSVNSLGNMNVTGLLSIASLPKQYEIPPYLNTKFQKQLLEQDFYPGRAISCSISRINPTANPDILYNLKLEFEEFIDKFDDKDGISSDDIRLIEDTEGIEDEEDEDDFIDEYEEDSFDNDDDDVIEIYEELRGDQPLLPVQNIMDWADIQDMISEGTITQAIFDTSIKRLGSSKDGFLTKKQFSNFIGILQDVMLISDPEEIKQYFEEITFDNNDSSDNNDGDSNNSNSNANMNINDSTMTTTTNTSDTINRSSRPQSSVSNSIENKLSLDDESNHIPIMKSNDLKTANDIFGDENDGEDEVTREIYDELRGSSEFLDISKFNSWSDIRDLIESNLLTKDFIKQTLIQQNIKKAMTYEQFVTVLDILDDSAAEKEQSLGFMQSDSFSNLSVEPAKPKTDIQSSLQLDGNNFNYDDKKSKDEEMVKDLFDNLKTRTNKVLVKKYLESDEIVKLVKNGIIRQEDIDRFLVTINITLDDEITITKFKKLYSFVDDAKSEYRRKGIEVTENKKDESVLPISTNGNEKKVEIDTKSKDNKNIENDNNDNDISDEDFDEMTKELFDSLKSKSNKVSVKKFLLWDEIKEMLDEGIITNKDIDTFLSEIRLNRNSEMTYDQFKELIAIVDDATADIEDSESNDDEYYYDGKGEDDGERQEEEDDDSDLIAEIYDSLKGKKNYVSVKDFMAWDEFQDTLSQGLISTEEFDSILSELGTSKSGKLSLDQFKELIDMVDECAATNSDDEYEDKEGEEEDDEGQINTIQSKGVSSNSMNQNKMSKPTQTINSKQQQEDDNNNNNDDDDDDDFGDLSEEDLEAMRKEIFDELKSPKTNRLTIKQLMSWESLQEAMESGDMTKKEILSAVKQAKGDLDPRGMTYEEFRKVVAILDGSDEDEEEEEEDEKEVTIPSPTAGKGFAPISTATSIGIDKSKGNKDSKVPAMKTEDKVATELDSLTREIYDDLRGKRKTVSIQTFRDWEDTKELMKSGGLKLSTLERGFVKVGADKTEELTYSQFNTLLDYIQQGLELSDFDNSVIDQMEKDKVSQKTILSNSMNNQKNIAENKNSNDSSMKDDENFDDDDHYHTDLVDEEMAREVFSELKKPKKDTVTLTDFIQWEDIQQLLNSSALKKEDLAMAITNVGAGIDDPNLSFEQFYDLLQVIDTYVDKDKLPIIEDIESLEGDKDAVLEISNISSKSRGLKIQTVSTDEDDSDLDDLFPEGDLDNEEDILYMFKDLAKDKDYITEKDLRNWPDVKDMIDAGLITKNTVDKYLSDLNIKDGKVPFETFQRYISMIDTVLVDASGNILDIDDKDKAINMDRNNKSNDGKNKKLTSKEQKSSNSKPVASKKIDSNRNKPKSKN